MVERGSGNIVVTASMAGLGGMPGDVAYTATKHAVVGLVKSLGSSLMQQGVDVCVSALCPGFVNTPLIAGAVVVPLALPHLRSGRARALGVFDTQRSPLLPDAPPLAHGCCAGGCG